MAYRTSFIEKDLSGFVQGKPGATGAMVLRSIKGPDTPIYCQGEDDVILHFGLPSAVYPDVFEAISFCKEAPAWIVSAIGDEAVYGGIDVNQTTVTAFGAGAGRVEPASVNFASINTYGEMTPVGTVNGVNAQFTGTATSTPVETGTLVVTIDDKLLVLDDAAGLITGTDIDATGTNTIDLTTGAYDFTLDGTAGTLASVTTTVDLTADADLSALNTAGSQTITNTGSLATFGALAVPAIPTQVDYELDITIDAGTVDKLVDISINVLDDWTDIALAIQTSLQTATGSTETVTIVGGIITVTSATAGATPISSVLIAAGTNGGGSGDLLGVIDGIGATYTTSIDAATAGTDVDYAIKVTVDGTAYDNIDLGHEAATTRADVVTAINTAVGSTVCVINDVGGEFIDISGLIGDSLTGAISVADPTTGASGLTLVFSTGGTALTDTATSPSGAIPKNGSVIKVGWVYNTDKSATISHSFFTTSPYADTLAGKVEYVSGNDFTLTLYEVVGTLNYVELDVYQYSLDRKKDNFGRSMYYEDVFRDDPYVELVVNSDYAGGAYVITGSIVEFTGGYRGETTTEAQVQTQWALYQQRTKYPSYILMDCAGQAPVQVNNIIASGYQEFAHAITTIPLGNTVANAVIARSATAINSDNTCMYTNWAKIVDPYNDSAAWISHVGSVGRKYALCVDAYNAASPAGIDESNHGGLISDWQVLEMEYDYSDADLQTLDEAQINPIIFDDTYGIMIYGDKTMQSTLSDTSYVGTRRLYNYMIEMIIKHVLRKQEFKLNDELHRLTAKMMTEDFLTPIEADGWLADVQVQCDDKNNNDVVKNQRKFILDIFVKVMPNSQFCQLKLTRLSQTQSIAQFIS